MGRLNIGAEDKTARKEPSKGDLEGGERILKETGLTNSREELCNDADEVSQAEAVVSDNAFYLMKLREMSGVKALVTKHAVDAEQLHRLEAARLLGERVNNAVQLLLVSWGVR